MYVLLILKQNQKKKYTLSDLHATFGYYEKYEKLIFHFQPGMMEHQIMLVLNVCKTVRAHMRINKTCVCSQIGQHQADSKFDPSNTSVDWIVTSILFFFSLFYYLGYKSSNIMYLKFFWTLYVYVKDQGFADSIFSKIGRIENIY